MKRKLAILTVLISCSAFSLVGCSKTTNAIPPSPITSKFLKGADGPPLWIVDNIEISDLNATSRDKTKMTPNNIKSITALSPASTADLVKQYGPKGKNGVILVMTKK